MIYSCVYILIIIGDVDHDDENEKDFSSDFLSDDGGGDDDYDYDHVQSVQSVQNVHL